MSKKSEAGGVSFFYGWLVAVQCCLRRKDNGFVLIWLGVGFLLVSVVCMKVFNFWLNLLAMILSFLSLVLIWWGIVKAFTREI